MPDSLINKNDFRTVELEGITNSSANTAQRFLHSMNQVPWAWFPLEGSVYVPKEGLGPKDIDIRSARTSEPFRILLVFN